MQIHSNGGPFVDAGSRLPDIRTRVATLARTSWNQGGRKQRHTLRAYVYSYNFQQRVLGASHPRLIDASEVLARWGAEEEGIIEQ